MYENCPCIVVDKAGVRFSLFFVYTGANFALLPVDPFFSHPSPLTHSLTHTLTQNRSPASGTATSMWGMSCENRQQIPPERAQQGCMLRLTAPHNPKVVGSNPAPATKDPRFYYLGFSFVFCWTSPTFTVSISAVAVQPALFFLQNGQQRTTPELLGSGVVFPPDPYLTHTAASWVWVKLWSGYRRIPAPGIFLTAPSAPKPRPFSWLPPAGRWW